MLTLQDSGRCSQCAAAALLDLTLPPSECGTQWDTVGHCGETLGDCGKTVAYCGRLWENEGHSGTLWETVGRLWPTVTDRGETVGRIADRGVGQAVGKRGFRTASARRRSHPRNLRQGRESQRDAAVPLPALYTT